MKTIFQNFAMNTIWIRRSDDLLGPTISNNRKKFNLTKHSSFSFIFQMLAANTIRQVADEENLSCKIGFFLHIPFPSWDIVKIFPWVDIVIQVQT